MNGLFAEVILTAAINHHRILPAEIWRSEVYLMLCREGRCPNDVPSEIEVAATLLRASEITGRSAEQREMMSPVLFAKAVNYRAVGLASEVRLTRLINSRLPEKGFRSIFRRYFAEEFAAVMGAA